MAHKPNDTTRKQVQKMSGMGLSQDAISDVLEITKKTLIKHYAVDLRKGKSHAHYAVAKRLYEKCMEGDRTALIFWAKTQMGFKETQVVENSENLQVALKFE